jgi:hypothetical protein
MKRMMTAVLVLLVSAALPVRAERRRAAVLPVETLSIVFVEVGSGDESLKAAGSEAWLDLNAVTHSGSERSTRLRRRFGIRIERAGNATAGTAAQRTGSTAARSPPRRFWSTRTRLSAPSPTIPSTSKSLSRPLPGHSPRPSPGK